MRRYMLNLEFDYFVPTVLRASTKFIDRLILLTRSILAIKPIGPGDRFAKRNDFLPRSQWQIYEVSQFYEDSAGIKMFVLVSPKNNAERRTVSLDCLRDMQTWLPSE